MWASRVFFFASMVLMRPRPEESVTLANSLVPAAAVFSRVVLIVVVLASVAIVPSALAVYQNPPMSATFAPSRVSVAPVPAVVLARVLS